MKNINATETTAYVCFNFGSCARVGVTLYEGLTVDECIALRSEDIEEYKIEGGEWTTRKATADEARKHLEDLRTEETETGVVTLAPAESGCVWDEDGNLVEPETEIEIVALRFSMTVWNEDSGRYQDIVAVGFDPEDACNRYAAEHDLSEVIPIDSRVIRD